MQKVISFSLWGNGLRNKPYFKGAINNLKLAKVIYPEWEVHMYVGKNSVKPDEVKELELNGAIIHEFDDSDPWYGLFVRFELAGKVDYFLVKDCDSSLNWRERACIDAWIESSKSWHIIRDNLHHSIPMVGDLWGCTKGSVMNIKSLFDKWLETHTSEFGADQFFLTEVIWPIAKKDCIQFDIMDRAFNQGWIPFPKHRTILPCKFVGETRITDEHIKRKSLLQCGEAHKTDKVQHGYLDIYDNFLNKFRDKQVKLLEIGVRGGNSMRMWEEYFDFYEGIGFDIEDKCKVHETNRTKIIIGNQNYESDLAKCGEGFDIILDDGSHINKHIIKSFEYLFPKMNHGGIYIIEDLQCSYLMVQDGGQIKNWPGMDKNDQSEDLNNYREEIESFFLKQIQKVDKGDQIKSIHFYKRFCIIEKE